MSSTLENVLTDMVMVRGGTDRGALVRSIQEGAQPAVCVIMTSKQALRRLGKPLVNIARKLGNAPADFGCPEINEKIGMKALFEIADAAPNGWCWASFRYYKLNVTLAIFCRSLEDVARVCNEQGAPCSFDRHRPADGYEIEQVLNRR
jgi:hypothetical protein